MSGRPVDRGPTPVEGRLVDARYHLLHEPEPDQRAYNHAVFCQTSFPYRLTKDTRFNWKRVQGNASIRLQAGYAPVQFGSHQDELVPLPSGPRARLVLIHIMTQVILNQHPVVQLEDSFTAFVKRLGIAPSGRNIRSLREQLRRLATCTLQIRINRKDNNEIIRGGFVDSFQVFAPKAPGQRVLWPSFIRMAQPFFKNLLQHAVPLDPRALGALKHSASALDTYQWLAHRLCRIPSGRTQLISWSALHQQLGGSSCRVGAWKQEWLGDKDDRLGALPQVLMVYPAAKDAIEITQRGLVLKQAEPPVSMKHLQAQKRLGSRKELNRVQTEQHTSASAKRDSARQTKRLLRAQELALELTNLAGELESLLNPIPDVSDPRPTHAQGLAPKLRKAVLRFVTRKRILLETQTHLEALRATPPRLADIKAAEQHLRTHQQRT